MTIRNALRCVVALTVALCVCAANAAPPHLEGQGNSQRLIVNGEPMLMLGGELGNSSASSAAYMAPHWSRLKQMHVNTVLAPVYWELVEPVEGRFDFSSVDAMVNAARANELKLVVLWFGAWKNSMSTYVPSWVKRDQQRFPRVQLENGRSVEILSSFVPATLEADSRAFAALLRHLKQIDAEQSTVLMVQVENEIGMLPVAREHGTLADKAFAEAVPKVLIQRLTKLPADAPLRQLWQRNGAKASGDWAALFGDGDAGAEIFTAWHYARFVESLVRAGKAEYALPMYVNCALNRTGRKPGEYPSGGPLPHLLEVWQTGAPSLDLLAPDIYFPNFVDLAAAYKRADNVLFIPEANNADKPEVPANAFYAFGKLDAIGFSPFSIESIDETIPNSLSRAYAVLEQLSPTILAAQGHARMTGFRPRVLEDGTLIEAPVSETLGDFRFNVAFIDPWTPKAGQKIGSHGGLVIQTGPEEFLIAGQGITITFEALNEPKLVGIDSAWEGVFDEQGRWVPGRLLNGDQTHQGRHIRLAPGQVQIQRVKLYRFR
jgi:beta-galactosidase GanA